MQCWDKEEEEFSHSRVCIFFRERGSQNISFSTPNLSPTHTSSAKISLSLNN
jgi:hypothetical protein